MVGHQVLVLGILVRVQASQHKIFEIAKTISKRFIIVWLSLEQ